MGHDSQATEPNAALNEPAGQALQAVAPAAAENVPGSHETGPAVALGQYWPAAAEQGAPVQVTAPVPLVSPAPHAKHELAPVYGW